MYLKTLINKNLLESQLTGWLHEIDDGLAQLKRGSDTQPKWTYRAIYQAYLNITVNLYYLVGLILVQLHKKENQQLILLRQLNMNLLDEESGGQYGEDKAQGRKNSRFIIKTQIMRPMSQAVLNSFYRENAELDIKAINPEDRRFQQKSAGLRQLMLVYQQKNKTLFNQGQFKHNVYKKIFIDLENNIYDLNGKLKSFFDFDITTGLADSLNQVINGVIALGTMPDMPIKSIKHFKSKNDGSNSISLR